MYTLTENEKVKIITMSSEEYFYYVTVDKETPTNEVMKIINDVQKVSQEMKSIIYLAGHLLLKLIDNGQVICYLLLRQSGYKAA